VDERRQTVGFAIEGRATLHLEGQQITFEEGDSWVVPAGAEHTDTEAVRGQEAVTRDDIARLPEVVGNPDRVIRGEPKRGLERLKYEKRYNSTTYVVEEARTGAEELATVTMYKQKGGGSGALGATDESGPSGVLHTSAPESESDAPFPGQPPSGNTASEGEGSSTDLAQTSELSEPALTELARRRMDERASGTGVQTSNPTAAGEQQGLSPRRRSHRSSASGSERLPWSISA